MRGVVLFVLLASSVRAESLWTRIANFFTSQLKITTTALPIGKTGTLYSTTLTATGGKTPYRWSIQPISTIQAANLALSGSTLSGTPQIVVNGSVLNISVLDKTSRQANVSLPLAICAPLRITSGQPPNGIVGKPYTFQLTTAGGIASTNPPACNP